MSSALLQKVAIATAASGVFRPQKARAAHFLMRQEVNARAVHPASVVRVIVRKVTVLSVRVARAIVLSERVRPEIARIATGEREIGRGPQDRQETVHSGIEARAGDDRKAGATVVIFQRRNHALVIVLPK